MGQFVEFYNDCVRNGYRGFIEVIHGYGSSSSGGAIQRELRRYLAANSDRLEMYVPGDSLGNPGMTKVFPKRLLPAVQDKNGPSSTARQAILRFCDLPRSKDRILSRLTGRFGDRVLRDEIDCMVRDGLLRERDGKLERQ
jgi:hypothetical protein